MITTDTRKKIFSAMLYAACALPMSAVAGQSVEEPSSTTVANRYLEISSSEDMKALDRRLRRAAKQACGPSDFRMVGWSAARSNRQCADQAVARAWAERSTSIDLAP